MFIVALSSAQWNALSWSCSGHVPIVCWAIMGRGMDMHVHTCGGLWSCDPTLVSPLWESLTLLAVYMHVVDRTMPACGQVTCQCVHLPAYTCTDPVSPVVMLRGGGNIWATWRSTYRVPVFVYCYLDKMLVAGIFSH